MSKAKPNQFRERFTEMGGGLKKEKEERPRLPSAQGLKLDSSLDISKVDNFTAPAVDIKGVAERIKPQGGGELRVETDLGKLDEGIEKIKAQQTNAAIRSLVEEAEKLMAQQKYKPALKPLDKALTIDPTSAQALFLKGYCLYSLEEYERAQTVLDEARRHARDAETVVVILMLHAACTRAATELIEDKLIALIEKERYREALALLDEQLRHQPRHVAFLYHRCGVFLVMGKMPEARRAALDAKQLVDANNAGLFDEILDQITMHENVRYLEAARLALRRGNPAQALKELEPCRVLAGQQQYEAIRTYAEEKNPRGFLSALFSRNKAKPLDEPTLQKLLMWLLDEELEAGLKALNGDKFDQAVTIFDKAGTIDVRCKMVCFMHGVALFNQFKVMLEGKKPPDINQSITSLEKAASLLHHAESDPVVAQQSRNFLKAVEGYLSELREVLAEFARRETEDKPINELIKEFNAVMDSLESGSIGSVKDLDNAEKKFRGIREKAEKIRKGKLRKDAEEIVKQIIAAADRNLKQVEDIRGEFSKTKLVKECVTGFTEMMEHFQKHPISNQRELQTARDRVKALKTKVTQARATTQRGGEVWQVLDQVDEALRKAEKQLY